MKVKSVSLRNFRCFGSDPLTVDFSEDLTALIGGNGAGKTAVLAALTRLFGTTQSLRTIQKSDFHLPPGVAPDERDKANLSIGIDLSFPELNGSDETSHTVPPAFHHMVIESPNADPFARIRLDATWSDDGTSEGHVEQELNWVLTADEDETKDQLRRISPHERGLIQVQYVPANRDPAPEIRGAARSRIGRLLRAASWQESTLDTVKETSTEIGEAIGSEQAVQLINGFLQERWNELRDSGEVPSARLNFAGSGLDEIIRAFGVGFQTDVQADEIDISRLSDGQLSLFYLALVAAVFDIERQVAVEKHEAAITAYAESEEADESEAGSEEPDCPGSEAGPGPAFKHDRISTPALTIFAIEEPENHLAPHYLARIVGLLRTLTGTGQVQALFSSHSPSVLRRVSPEDIRYLRLNEDTRATQVKKITLPDTSDAASKFVREAVLAYPELYFGKFVILAEGPSEEMVLPRIASASDLEIDESFVSVVPLGGRHVNHFWKLLTELDIPHATLLDLDIGRESGGWARIKYVCDQLLQNGKDESDLLEFEYKEQLCGISKQDLSNLHTKEIEDFSDFYPWIEHLEKFNVYFSGPLDFDMSMLRALPDAYQNIEGQNGPAIPDVDSPERDPYCRRAIEASVGNREAIIELYMNKCQFKELYPWYRYLFLNRSKPSTHLMALAGTENSLLKKEAPTSLKRLLKLCKETLQS